MRSGRRPHRIIWMLIFIAVMVMTACGPAAPTEEIYVVVTSTTPVPTVITPLAPVITALPSITPTLPSGAVDELNQVPAATQPPSNASCDGAPPTRLSNGASARVTITNGIPVNVRESAGISSERVGSMPEGTEFTAILGPICADSMWWWEISSPMGYGGWVAEGDSSGYFLEPYP